MTVTAPPLPPTLQLEFVGQYPAPPAERLRHANAALLEQYLNSWTRAFGEPNYQEDGDFENFVETMARFDAAGRAFGYGNTTVINQAGEHLFAHFQLSDGAPILPGEEVEPDFVFGPVATWGYGHQHRSGDSTIADRYWDIPAFKGLSGRRWELAGFYPDDPGARDIVQVHQAMFDDGVRDFVVKGTEPKTLLEMFSLTARPEELYGGELPSDLTDGVMHREGNSAVFLVQERIPMTFEYRVFMAGPNPVAAAGCIEDYTPLDSRGAVFDPRFEEMRGSGDVVWNQMLADEMKLFARHAGQLLYGQAPQLGAAWVMDLARNADTGEIVVIELNPARNAGLYASSPNAWMEGIRSHLTSSR